MIANISGCLVNSHSVFEVPMPRLPTYVNILGTTIEKELKPLPEDISDFMDGAEHGVVLLTMGMTYVPSDIPPHLERRHGCQMAIAGFLELYVFGPLGFWTMDPLR